VDRGILWKLEAALGQQKSAQAWRREPLSPGLRGDRQAQNWRQTACVWRPQTSHTLLLTLC
jgi:hypothetical protein